MNDLETEIRYYIVNEFLKGEDAADLTDDFDLIENGIVNSLGLVRVVSHISTRYMIHLDDIPLDPDSFRDIRQICSFIRKACDPALT